MSVLKKAPSKKRVDQQGAFPPDQLVPLTLAAKKFPASSVCHSTLWRWCVEGFETRSGQTIYLEFSADDRRYYTCRKWYDAFTKALAQSNVESFRERRAKRKARMQNPTPVSKSRLQKQRDDDKGALADAHGLKV